MQSGHFIEQEGVDTARKDVFYGQEKNPDVICIAKMHLAVHGPEEKIADAIIYHQDEHTLVGKCDFVMANPPFNVDLVDAERIKGDPRLPFGLSGVNGTCVLRSVIMPSFCVDHEPRPTTDSQTQGGFGWAREKRQSSGCWLVTSWLQSDSRSDSPPVTLPSSVPLIFTTMHSPLALCLVMVDA